MFEPHVPRTVLDFVSQRIQSLPPIARLVVVFDPYADLPLSETFTVENGGQQWRVLRYDGNDLAFRRQQFQEAGGRDLIWVSCPPAWRRETTPRIELSSLMDVWRRADAWVDASLPGVLRSFVPTETWPEQPVWEHAAILSQNLPAVISGLQTMRRHLTPRTALDEHTVRALALHCLQPNLPIERFLFRVDTPSRVLDEYVDLLWSTDWQTEGVRLLQIQARRATRLDLRDISTWLDIPPATVALYIYLRRVLGQFHVPNIANQLRGLGLLDIDTEVLEGHVGSILARWERATRWRAHIISQAEKSLEADEISINRIVRLLSTETPEQARDTLSRAETPAMIYALQTEFFGQAFRNRRVSQYIRRWPDIRPPAVADLPETPFTAHATRLVKLFDELAFIAKQRRCPIPAEEEIAPLLDWYVANKLYDLEYAHARAREYCLYLPDGQLKDQLKAYLDRQQGKTRDYLDILDHRLADLITRDWSAYVNHPRLATNILWNTVKKRRITATPEARLWIVVFDGMRWDTWARHVKPCLLELFEFVEPEKPYISLLPSWTRIARTGLLAGKLPGQWKGHTHTFTRDQAQLTAVLFNIPRNEQDRQVQFFAATEGKREQIEKGYPYNVLVYNISDDNLHNIKGDLVDLNRVVKVLLDNILQTLNNLIEANDTLVVCSDHGFVELSDEGAVVVAENNRVRRLTEGEDHPVRYRYLTTHEVPADLTDRCKVEYTNWNEQFTVAIGKRWFKREDERGHDRYAHGGLSLAEMTVPGAILRRIKKKKVQLLLTVLPEAITATENEEIEVAATVVNKGNTLTAVQLSIQADFGAAIRHFSFDLPPTEERQVRYKFKAGYRKHSSGKVESTKTVNVTLDYNDLEDKAKRITKRTLVTVKPRTDIVELDFGGLPDIDV